MPGESSSAVVLAPRSRGRLVHADLPKYLTKDEVARLLAACARARDRLLLRVMWETGVRVSELLALTPASIDFAAEAGTCDGLPFHAAVSIGPYSALIFSQ